MSRGSSVSPRLASFLVRVALAAVAHSSHPSSSSHRASFDIVPPTHSPPAPGQSPAQPPPLCPLQDDMHRVIDRQLMDTHLKERSPLTAALSRAHGAGRGDEPSTAEGKWLFSFFRKI